MILGKQSKVVKNSAPARVGVLILAHGLSFLHLISRWDSGRGVGGVEAPGHTLSDLAAGSYLRSSSNPLCVFLDHLVSELVAQHEPKIVLHHHVCNCGPPAVVPFLALRSWIPAWWRPIDDDP